MKSLLRCTTLVLTAFFCLFFTGLQTVCGKTVTLPLQVDYPILRSLLIAGVFTSPGPALVLVDETDDCRQIRLFDPHFAPAGNRIRLEMAVDLKGGTTMGDNCLFPVKWKGYIRLHARPKIDRTRWQMNFEWQDSQLLDADHQQAVVMDRLWKIFEKPVLARLSGLAIDLTPPMNELAPFLLSMASGEDRERIRKFLETLKPADMAVSPTAVTLNVSGRFETADPPAQKEPEKPLSAGELAGFIKTWETWDSFLVNAMLALSGGSLTREERQVLFDVLIETRYRFVAELEKERQGPDFVRQQFVRAWKRLSPIFRKHLGQSRSIDPWAYLSFLTASDALGVLDKLGPAVNLDISREGLLRLARMISTDSAPVLECTPAVNQKLRDLLGLGPSLDACAPVFDEKELKLNQTARHERFRPAGLLAGVQAFFMPDRCWAATPETLPNIRELRQWLVSRKNLETYFQKVKALLNNAVQKNFDNGNIPSPHQQLFKDLVYATAWQESCFRQFIVKDQKVIFIKSYNNTSVGMMQINERVWRGIYDLQHLRWNVGYNVAAGIEILDRYLTRYALGRGDAAKTLSPGELAGCVYAMYNGGPSQFQKFLNRRKNGDYYAVDRYFMEKYQWVRNGQWDRLSDCLF